jgi:hypothetical protein
MYRLLLTIISVFSVWATPVLAKDAGAHLWVVSQLSGDARVIRSGLQPASLTVNARLAPGDMVVTGATGRATLAKGADYIVMAPRSELRLPASPQPNGFTRVMQNIGTMLFKVRHTGVPHFAVDTPMLAAVVKGTTFTVVVDKDRSAVQVTEGAVEVVANDGGMERLVAGGRTVFIKHNDPKTLIEADPKTNATTAPSSSAVNIIGSATPSVATIASLTGGLVRAEAAQPTFASTAPHVVTAAPTTTVTAPTATPTVTTAGITDPIVGFVDTTAPAVTNPAAGLVDTTVPGVTDPIVDIVNKTLPSIMDPVVDLVDTTPKVTEPIIDIVEPVTEPVIEVVESITEPLADVVEPVTAPVLDVIDAVTEPVLKLPGLTL